MKITKYYKEGTSVEDFTQDKFIIEMTTQDYLDLESILFSERVKGNKKALYIHEALIRANENRKAKWVK